MSLRIDFGKHQLDVPRLRRRSRSGTKLGVAAGRPAKVVWRSMTQLDSLPLSRSTRSKHSSSQHQPEGRHEQKQPIKLQSPRWLGDSKTFMPHSQVKQGEIDGGAKRLERVNIVMAHYLRAGVMALGQWSGGRDHHVRPPSVVIFSYF